MPNQIFPIAKPTGFCFRVSFPLTLLRTAIRHVNLSKVQFLFRSNTRKRPKEADATSTSEQGKRRRLDSDGNKNEADRRRRPGWGPNSSRKQSGRGVGFQSGYDKSAKNKSTSDGLNESGRNNNSIANNRKKFEHKPSRGRGQGGRVRGGRGSTPSWTKRGQDSQRRSN